jgi:ABC exporter DevB family membrane fusion protein
LKIRRGKTLIQPINADFSQTFLLSVKICLICVYPRLIKFFEVSKMKKTLILSAIAILLTIGSVVYFTNFRSANIEQKVIAEEQQNAVKPLIETAKMVVAPGYVEPISEEIEVGSEIAGKIKQVLVEEGEQVLKGQEIAILENSDFLANINNAKAQIVTLQSQKETAQAKILQTKADKIRIQNGAKTEERREAKVNYESTLPNIENAKREFERRQRLYQTGDVSREEFERAKTNYENAQKQSEVLKAKFNVVNSDARRDDLDKADAAIKLAETQIFEIDAQIREAQTRVRTAEANLDKTIVKSPITGIILRKRLHDGETISPENSRGIVTIADVSALRVRVEIDETDVAKVKIGQSAYVKADAFGEQKFTAKVIKIGQVLGRKNVRTERPTEKIDTKILEVLLELDKNQTLPLQLRVDAFIETEKNL